MREKTKKKYIFFYKLKLSYAQVDL